MDDQELLDRFFTDLNQLMEDYMFWTEEKPKMLAINPGIVSKLSRLRGFYERPELRALVPAHAPVVRYFRLITSEGEEVVVTLYDDWQEKYLHFE